MPSYFTRSRPGSKAVRWQLSPAVARLAGLPVKPKRKLRTEEHDAQAALFADHIWPRLVDGSVAFAIPNGGHRAKRVAIALREEGVVSGVPDIFIMHAGVVYFLEMKKAKGGRVSREQKQMMARLVGAGAICAVAAGLDAAIKQLEAWDLLTSLAATGVTEEMAA